MLAIPGINYISYTYTDLNGCQGTSSDSLFVDLCLGTSEITMENLNVYPNPGYGHLTLSTSASELGLVTLYNIIGEVIYQENIDSNEKEFLLLESGTYIFFVIDANGLQSFRRVLITR